MEKYHKLITFDLDTNVLKNIYHAGVYTKAYYDLEQFFKEHHFTEHKQGSCYISDIKMSNLEITDMLKEAKTKLVWFKYGVKDMRVANLESPEFSNLTHIAQNGKNEKEYDELVRKTQESRKQKQLEAIKSYKLKNETSTPSKNIDKER